MAASAVNDMIHLLAELIENATLFSPSTTRVEVRAERVANGFAIEVEDRGLGIAPGPARRAQRRGWPARPTSTSWTPTGSACSSRACWPPGTASRSRSTPSPYRGTKAIVLLPDDPRARQGRCRAGARGRRARRRTRPSPEPFPWSARPWPARCRRTAGRGTRSGAECGRTGPRPPSTACRAGSGRVRAGRSRPSHGPGRHGPDGRGGRAPGGPRAGRRPPARGLAAERAGSGARRKTTNQKRPTPRRPVSHGAPWNRPGQCSTRRRKSDGNRRGVGGARPRLVAR